MVLEVRKRRLGFVAIEVAAVVTVLSLLLAMGFALYSGMRQAARVSVAESNLKQVSTGMELYFRKYSSYPPQGTNLTVELAPFVNSPEIFANPLADETVRGETINELYREPSLQELDGADHYLTAMVSDDGTTAVILKTGGKVERRDDLQGETGGELLALLDPPATPDPGTDPEPPDDPPVTTSPDDYSQEIVPGVIRAVNDTQAKFVVLASNLTSGSTDVPVFVQGKFGQAITYVVVQDGINRVKFEDATTGLGDDGAAQTDRFVMTVQGTTSSVSVTTKAGTASSTTELPAQVGATALDSNGFRVTVEDISDDNVYTVSVTSQDNSKALSHVEFDFGDDAQVTVTDGCVDRYSGVPLFNGEDVDGGEVDYHALQAGESFALIGDAVYNGSWSTCYSSDIDITQVLTLRNGDQLAGGVVLAPWLFDVLIDPVSRKVTIGDNQVLFLYELGVTNPSYFDLDDLVVLVTLEEPTAADPAP